MDAVCAKVDAANRVTLPSPSLFLLQLELGFKFDFFWRHPVAEQSYYASAPLLPPCCGGVGVGLWTSLAGSLGEL